MVRRTETRRARSERYTEQSSGKTVLRWRMCSCTLIREQEILLSDGRTKKRCAVISVHGLDKFQALRFVSMEDLSE